MKTMTCKQLGGPCDHAHHGESADDVIKDQDQHLKDMQGRWKRPISGMKWYKTAKKDFAALPDDVPAT